MGLGGVSPVEGLDGWLAVSFEKDSRAPKTGGKEKQTCVDCQELKVRGAERLLPSSCLNRGRGPLNDERKESGDGLRAAEDQNSSAATRSRSIRAKSREERCCRTEAWKNRGRPVP